MDEQTTEDEPVGVETDGGHTHEDTPSLTTYTDDEYGYTIAYPAGWSVERDPTGTTTFEATEPSRVGAAVFVEENGPVAESATAFLDELDADENIHALEMLVQRDEELESGRTARVVECAYTDDSCERWRSSYLFVRAGDTGYTVGVDWNDATFEATAAAILESFALEAK